MNILIPDGSGGRPFYRSVLAMVRSLGSEHRVFIGATTSRLLGLQRLLQPRSCAGIVRMHDPSKDAQGFVADVEQLRRRLGLEVLLPYSDEIATVVSEYRGDIHLAVPLASYASFSVAIDKERTTQLAQELGIPTPQTICSSDTEEIISWASRPSVGFPLTLKPRRRGAGPGTVRIPNAERLRAAVRHFEQVGDELPTHAHTRPVIQETVPGEIHDCCMLYERGTLKAVLTQLRLRTLEPTGGIGVVNVTTDVPEIKLASHRLMDRLNWHGPAQVEWIRDARSGTYRLLEINPRFWGTLELATDAGINFPGLTVDMLGGKDVGLMNQYRVGIRRRWVFPEELSSVLADRWNLARWREYIRLSDVLDSDCRISIDLSDLRPELFRIVDAGTRVVERARVAE